MSHEKQVTVVMRTKDSDWIVDRALAGLFSQQDISFELLIVDSGSRDRTFEMIARYPHRRIDIERGSYLPGKVLNQAVEACNTKWVAFQNSDVVQLDPLVLKRLVDVAETEDCVATFARQLPRPEAWGSVRRDHDQAFPATGPAPDWLPLSLPMAVIRRDVLRSRPFYRDAWASEDTEWGLWARRNGHRIQYVADAPVMHSHNYSLRELQGRKYVEGEADGVMCNESFPWTRMMSRSLSEATRDCIYCLGHGRTSEIPCSIVRRFVGNLAYFRGRNLGVKRRNTRNQDVTIGQRYALARHRQ